MGEVYHDSWEEAIQEFDMSPEDPAKYAQGEYMRAYRKSVFDDLRT